MVIFYNEKNIDEGAYENLPDEEWYDEPLYEKEYR